MKKTLLATVLFSAFLWSACGDDSEGNDPEPQNQKTAREYLIDADWLVVAATIDPPIEIDIFGTKITINDIRDLDEAEPCERDDLLRFKADGRVEDDEGPTKCDPNDPQTSDGGTWTLSADGKELIIIDDDNPMEADTFRINLTILNDTDLKGTSSMEFEDPITEEPVEHTVTFEMKDQKG